MEKAITSLCEFINSNRAFQQLVKKKLKSSFQLKIKIRRKQFLFYGEIDPKTLKKRQFFSLRSRFQ